MYAFDVSGSHDWKENVYIHDSGGDDDRCA